MRLCNEESAGLVVACVVLNLNGALPLRPKVESSCTACAVHYQS